MAMLTDLWRGTFGDAYTLRNDSPELVRNNEKLFRTALAPLAGSNPPIQRVIEFGANIGLNLQALARIGTFCLCQLSAIEVNAKAAAELRKLRAGGRVSGEYGGGPNVDVYETSILDTDQPWGGGYDLTIVKGVLIHIHPDDLPLAYDQIHRASSRYIFLAEYFSPTPVEVEYRGERGRLFKRDFASEMLDRFPEMTVIDYGFAWRRDADAPQDDLNWWLLHTGKNAPR